MFLNFIKEKITVGHSQCWIELLIGLKNEILKKFKEICRIMFSINKDCKSVSLFTIFKDKYEGKNILRNGGLTLTRKCQLK